METLPPRPFLAGYGQTRFVWEATSGDWRMVHPVPKLEVQFSMLRRYRLRSRACECVGTAQALLLYRLRLAIPA